VIIKAAKRIFNSDKICRSYFDFYFGVTFFGTHCTIHYQEALYPMMGPFYPSRGGSGWSAPTVVTHYLLVCLFCYGGLFVFIFFQIVHTKLKSVYSIVSGCKFKNGAIEDSWIGPVMFIRAGLSDVCRNSVVK